MHVSVRDGGDRSGTTNWERKRRLAEVFGDVLPDTTADERDTRGDGHADEESATDRWLKSQVPPHHGG